VPAGNGERAPCRGNNHRGQGGVHKVRTLLEADARACLNKLAGLPEATQAVAGVASTGGWSLFFVPVPTPDGDRVPALTTTRLDPAQSGRE
jgi:hypothetical protein